MRCIVSAMRRYAMARTKGCAKARYRRKLISETARPSRSGARLRVVAAECADVVERPASQRMIQSPVARSDRRRRWFRLEHRFVKARRQHVDQVDVARKLAVLLARHAAGHEDAEVAGGLMDGVDDRLSIAPDFVDVCRRGRESSRALVAAA